MNYSQIMSPRPPLPRKVGGHDPPAPMGAPPLANSLLNRSYCSESAPENTTATLSKEQITSHSHLVTNYVPRYKIDQQRHTLYR